MPGDTGDWTTLPVASGAHDATGLGQKPSSLLHLPQVQGVLKWGLGVVGAESQGSGLGLMVKGGLTRTWLLGWSFLRF